MQSLTDSYTLLNGVKVPCVGFGTWQLADDKTAQASVLSALECGYRHIDTAAAYENEMSIGKAVKASGLNRRELFITSKLWNTDRGYKETLRAFQNTLNKLGTNYVDLYLIHWPAAKGSPEEWQEQNRDTWRAFEEIYDKKQARAIGVSNFLVHHLDPLIKSSRHMPVVNQIEFHPGHMQREVLKYCRSMNILAEAWSPLGQAKLLGEPTLSEIAANYGKTTAQLCLRWCLQHNTLPLPKSAHIERIRENTGLFDFQISQTDMERIDQLGDSAYSGHNPDRVDF